MLVAIILFSAMLPVASVLSATKSAVGIISVLGTGYDFKLGFHGFESVS